MNEKDLTPDQHLAHNELDDIGSKVEGADVSNVKPGSVDQTRTPAKRKLPYVKPAFRYEKVFVTSALACGKVSPVACSGMTKAS